MIKGSRKKLKEELDCFFDKKKTEKKLAELQKQLDEIHKKNLQDEDYRRSHCLELSKN